MAIAGWDKFSRDQRVKALARKEGVSRECPACGRTVEVVFGYWTQHTDPESYVKGEHPRPCRLEFTPA